MSNFTHEEVVQELKGGQRDVGLISKEIPYCFLIEEEEFFSMQYSEEESGKAEDIREIPYCCFIEEEEFFSIQYSEDESGKVGDIRELINLPELDHSGNLFVDLPILEMVNPKHMDQLPEDVIQAIWEPNLNDDLLNMEGLLFPYGPNQIITGSLNTFKFLISNGICIRTDKMKRFFL